MKLIHRVLLGAGYGRSLYTAEQEGVRQCKKGSGFEVMLLGVRCLIGFFMGDIPCVSATRAHG